MNENRLISTLEPEPAPLPPAGSKPALVRCRHCRCMAYRDKDGQWRDYFHRDALPEVLEVIFIE